MSDPVVQALMANATIWALDAIETADEWIEIPDEEIEGLAFVALGLIKGMSKEERERCRRVFG